MGFERDCFANLEDRELERKRQTYVARTIETASFRMDSPNTNMFRTWSISRAAKMASVATGSTAEIKAPKAMLSAKFNE